MNWFRNLRMQGKLLGGFGVVGAIAVAGVGVGVMGMRSIQAAAQELEMAEAIQSEFAQREIDHLTWVQMVRVVQDDGHASHLGVELNEHACGFGRWFYGNGRTQAESVVPGLADVIRRAEAPHAALHAGGRAIEALLAGSANDRAAAHDLMRSEVIPAVGQLQSVLRDARALVREAAAEAEQRAGRRMSRAQAVQVLAGSLVMILVVALAIVIARAVVRPVERAQQLMAEIGQGHLSERADWDASDELGRLIASMNLFASDLQTDVIGALDRISRGDVDVELTLRDDRDEISPALIRTRDSLRVLVDRGQGIAEAAVAGRLAHRAETDGLEGAYRDVIDGFNQTLDAISAPIEEAAAALDRVAARDLTVRMHGEYRGDYARIKSSLNQALDNLDSALTDVAAASDQVSSAAGQIATGSQSLAEGASEQASSLEEVSSSLQEMASMARQNSSNAGEARRRAEAASESTEKGSGAMRRLSMTVGQIQESSQATARIVKTIDEIAFQTNLLALNAAVEAARAGEAGKGFAVVAEEVRSLAMRSAEAAKETARLIEESVQRSGQGVVVQAEVVERLEEIRGGVVRVREVMEEIAAASEQQTDGVGQINGAVEEINTVTQRSAANSEESASAAEELSSQARRMAELVAGFQLSGERRDRPAVLQAAAAGRGPVMHPGKAYGGRTDSGNGTNPGRRDQRGVRLQNGLTRPEASNIA